MSNLKLGGQMRHYNKLVRDKILEIIEEHGEEPIYRIIKGEELEHRMVQKIMEEYHELLGAKGSEDELNEFADLYEILDAYRKKRGFTQAQVKDARKSKNAKRGAFRKGYYLAGVRPQRTEEELQNDAEAQELLKKLQNPRHRDTLIKIKRG